MLIYEELIQLLWGRDTEPVLSKQLKSKNLSKAFSYIEQGINILLEMSNVALKFLKELTQPSLKNEIDKKARHFILFIFYF